MLTRKEFQEMLACGPLFLDGATGSNLQQAGMPRGCCTEEWVLAHPETIISLQRGYAEAGSQIIYAPTFQAQPIALERVCLHRQAEAINAQLVALSRAAAPDCLIAGDLTTLAAFTESADPDQFDLLLENYRRQIRGLIDGGADLLVAETLLCPQEAEAILAAAELEGAGTVIYSFVMGPDGSLLSGMEAAPVLNDLVSAGAAAVGFNCACADAMTKQLVRTLKKSVSAPLLCKPNAGNPVINRQGIPVYSMGPEAFAQVMAECRQEGAQLLGGCCGTTPRHISAMIQRLKK